MNIQNWQKKTELLIGSTNLEKLRNSHVLIVGLGGVGSWATEHIVRAGIGEVTIVDSDLVTESNINRQLIALHSTIGKYKCDVIKERLLDINPELIINMHKKFLIVEDNDELFENMSYDYVLDCIDTLSPKIFLIQNCLDNNIPIISSLGSGAKTDHTAIKILDISKTYNCKLGRMLRKRLHKLGIYTGFKTVFSEELIDPDKIILEEGRNKRSNSGTISFLPAIFGTMMAAEVINDILELNK